MIQIDIVLAISVFLSVFLGVVFVLWIFYNFRGGRKKIGADSVEHVHQCPYCTYVFVSYQQTDVFMCPRCRSYIGDTPVSK